MEGGGTDVRFPADGRGRLAAFRPAQDRYDLLRGVSFSFSFGHLVPFLDAQSLISNGSVRVSQVNFECDTYCFLPLFVFDQFDKPSTRFLPLKSVIKETTITGPKSFSDHYFIEGEY